MNHPIPSLVRPAGAFFLLFLLVFAQSARAYGPIGHQIVGAIADARLSGTPTAAKIHILLQGFSLEKASVIPDEIKGWDKNGVDAPGIFRYSSRPLVDAQLADFWRANPPTEDHKSAMPSHHWFHYTDVPIYNLVNYRDGKVGRDQWDIVHMIRYCVRVLKGEEPEENARKITKPIAVILLAHYLGDIHQPLHVGAAYFDASGHAVDPDQNAGALEDQGGNSIKLKYSPTAAAKIGHADSKLHGFWDNQAVAANFPILPNDMPKEERRAQISQARSALVQELARTEPKDWRAPTALNPEDYGEYWADDILPLAREAHARLKFSDLAPKQDGENVIIAGTAAERPPADGVPYDVWAGQVVREELHKAGWRLADLLQKTL